MNVKLLAHTKVSEEMTNYLISEGFQENASHGQVIALTAIRTCYSPNKPSEIVALEGEKYFGRPAKDGELGTDADRLIRHIIRSGHTSTLEHLNFTFAVEGVSRSLLAQLTRHRHFSFSVQSQRYVSFGTNDKAQGYDAIIPQSIRRKYEENPESHVEFLEILDDIQDSYDRLRKLGVPAEDARYVLPNAATCNLVLTGNLRSLLDFYSKRSAKGAQWEIKELADHLKNEVTLVEPWTENFFKVGE